MGFYNDVLNIARNAAGLAITTGSSPTAKTVNTVTYNLDGGFYTKAAVSVPIINKTAINANGGLTTSAFTLADGFQTFLTVYLDSAGAVTIGEGDVLANTAVYNSTNIDRTQQTNGKAIIGYIWIVNASGSTFTGGTTALDASNVTVVYIDTFAPIGV